MLYYEQPINWRSYDYFGYFLHRSRSFRIALLSFHFGLLEVEKCAQREMPEKGNVTIDGVRAQSPPIFRGAFLCALYTRITLGSYVKFFAFFRCAYKLARE